MAATGGRFGVDRRALLEIGLGEVQSGHVQPANSCKICTGSPTGP